MPWVILSAVGRADAAQPALTVTPGPSGGSYRSGQTVTVSVGPNSFFTPLLKVNILECADPGGKTANLPTSISSCDGNSIQGGTILINHDGSFSANDYQVFSLPNATLGEQSNKLPVCNATEMCVLYVGQNQEDFTQPKLFSAPFTVVPDASRTASGTATTASSQPATTTTAQATAPSVSPTTTTAPIATASSLAPSDPAAAALANTGAPALLGWLAGLAAFLILSGSAGIRCMTRLRS